MDQVVNTRLSRVCGLATRQRVLLTLRGFKDLTENENDELLKNSIQAYVQYPEELKQKGKKVAMKVISHAWRTYKSRLVKFWRKTESSFITYKELREEDWTRFVAKYESKKFSMNSQYMLWLRS
jgi:L-lactate utilization protein LutC